MQSNYRGIIAAILLTDVHDHINCCLFAKIRKHFFTSEWGMEQSLHVKQNWMLSLS